MRSVLKAVGRWLAQKFAPFLAISAFMGLSVWAEAPDAAVFVVGMFWCLSALNLYPDRWIDWVLNGGSR